MEENKAEIKTDETPKEVEMNSVNYGPQQMLHVERDGKNFFLYFPNNTTYKEAYDAIVNILQGVAELSKQTEKALKEAEENKSKESDEASKDSKG